MEVQDDRDGNAVDSNADSEILPGTPDMQALVISREMVGLAQNDFSRHVLLEDPHMSRFESLLVSKRAQIRFNALRCLRDLCDSINGRYRVVEQGLVPVILSVLGQCGHLVEHQRLCLQIIRGLSLIEFGREELVQHATVSMLVKLIRSPDDDVRCSALRATFNLSVVNVRIRQSIVDCGALPFLIEASQVPSDGQCAAVGTLANLATEVDIKRAIVRKYNGLKPLLGLLRSNDTSILTHACRALFAIAANDENKLAITHEGGLPLLLDCMNSVCDAVRMNAAGALANLAIHPVNKLKLVERGALTHLRNLAFSGNCKIQRQVARCLFALAAHVENRKAILEENCLAALVHLLRSANFDVQVNAAGAIGNIAMTDDYKRPVVDSGALVRLIELASMPDTRVQRQAARAIFTLTAKEFSKRKLADNNGLPALIFLTKSRNEDIQRDAAGALANMAIGSENKDKIVSLGGLEPLISLLHSPTVAVQRQSARAIFALAGNANNQLAILKAGGLDPLINLLLSKNDEVQKHAAGAIANMANRHPARVVQGGALRMLVGIVLTHHSLEVRRQAARAVFNLTPPCNRRGQMVLTPYAGVAGEQQRVRHEMRALFETVLAANVTAPTYQRPIAKQRNTDSCAADDTDEEEEFSRCIQQQQQQQQFRQSGVGAGENRGRKRSCDDLLANVDTSSLRGSTGKRQSLAYDIIVSVPISDNSTTETALAEDQSEMYMETEGQQQIRLSSDASSDEEEKYADVAHPTSRRQSGRARTRAGVKSMSNQGAGRGVSMGGNGPSSRRSTATTAYMDFSGHAAILSARCDLIAALVDQKMRKLSRGAQKRRKGAEAVHTKTFSEIGEDPMTDDEDENTEEECPATQKMHIVIPEHLAFPREVWLAFMEYLYTDSVRKHAQVLRCDADVAHRLATLSLNVSLPRLCCFCLELCPSIATRNPAFRETTGDKARESTWVRDLSKLLPETVTESQRRRKGLGPISAVPDFSDIDVCLDPAFQQQGGAYSRSPRAAAAAVLTGTLPGPFLPCERPASMPVLPVIDSKGFGAMSLGHRDALDQDLSGHTSPKRIKTDRHSHQPAGGLFSLRGRFAAHKVILAARCAYFKAQFGSNARWKDASAPTVRFSASQQALRIFLRYLYCGTDPEITAALSEDPSVTLEVLVVANEYNLDGLQLLCESLLIGFVDENTVFVLLQELELVHAPLLRCICLSYLLETKNHEVPAAALTAMPRDSLTAEINGQSFDVQFLQSLAQELHATGVKWGFLASDSEAPSFPEHKLKQKSIKDYFNRNTADPRVEHC
ncbi:Importin subunit alpha-8 [Hondaea fermentalgiana]|uniref:Vacuolar protein 8 n=1 Tax=Hondaea fermentalgiana TaxID=2315210 RepID=A0A2R5GU27_9STRA|nr:Importin subunit alpha-8 [Hondaea fermentalgiana]|eukprot:GBG32153.1 Importin subunit alpha-8 [Hondaea fermentalgiana]